MPDDLTLAIQQAQPPDSGFRVGTVETINPLSVALQGGAVTRAGCLDSYYPVVGDSVIMARQDGSWCVLGTARSPELANVLPLGYAHSGMLFCVAGTVVSPAFQTFTTSMGISITKRYDGTALVHTAWHSFYATGGAEAGVTFGVSYGSIQVADVTSTPSNGSNGVRHAWPGTNKASLPAGTYAISMLWAKAGGAGTPTVDGGDMVALEVKEVWL